MEALAQSALTLEDCISISRSMTGFHSRHVSRRDMGLKAVGLTSGGGNLEAWTQAPSKPAVCHSSRLAISIADSSKCRAASGAGLSQTARPGVHLRRRCLGKVIGWIRFAASHPQGRPWHKAIPRNVGSSKGSAYLGIYFPYAPYGAGAMYLPPTAYGEDRPED